MPDLTVESLERLLYDDRTLVKHLCMRRTLFVLPATFLPVVQAACTNAIVATERKRLVRDVERGGLTADGVAWLRRAEEATLEALEELGSATGARLSRAVAEIQAKLSYAEGKPWGGQVGVAGRVYTILAAGGRIRRGRPSGSWTSSQHHWTLSPEPIASMDESEARAELVRRWLAAFGPATLRDLTWWTGLGVGKVRAALAASRRRRGRAGRRARRCPRRRPRALAGGRAGGGAAALARSDDDGLEATRVVPRLP